MNCKSENKSNRLRQRPSDIPQNKQKRQAGREEGREKTTRASPNKVAGQPDHHPGADRPFSLGRSCRFLKHGSRRAAFGHRCPPASVRESRSRRRCEPPAGPRRAAGGPSVRPGPSFGARTREARHQPADPLPRRSHRRARRAKGEQGAGPSAPRQSQRPNGGDAPGTARRPFPAWPPPSAPPPPPQAPPPGWSPWAAPPRSGPAAALRTGLTSGANREQRAGSQVRVRPPPVRSSSGSGSGSGCGFTAGAALPVGHSCRHAQHLLWPSEPAPRPLAVPAAAAAAATAPPRCAAGRKGRGEQGRTREATPTSAGIAPPAPPRNRPLESRPRLHLAPPPGTARSDVNPVPR